MNAELIEIARLIEGMKRECGMDPESPTAIYNGRLMSIAYKVRALAAQAPQAAEPVAVVCDAYELRWAGAGPIAPLIRRNGIKVGDKLYLAPQAPAPQTAEPAPVIRPDVKAILLELDVPVIGYLASHSGTFHKTAVDVDKFETAVPLVTEFDHRQACRKIAALAAQAPQAPQAAEAPAGALYVNDFGVTVRGYESRLGGLYHSDEAAWKAGDAGPVHALVRFIDVAQSVEDEDKVDKARVAIHSYYDALNAGRDALVARDIAFLEIEEAFGMVYEGTPPAQPAEQAAPSPDREDAFMAAVRRMREWQKQSPGAPWAIERLEASEALVDAALSPLVPKEPAMSEEPKTTVTLTERTPLEKAMYIADRYAGGQHDDALRAMLEQAIVDYGAAMSVAPSQAAPAAEPQRRGWLEDDPNFKYFPAASPAQPVVSPSQPAISKRDADYWLESRAAIITALDEAGFLITSDARGFKVVPAPGRAQDREDARPDEYYKPMFMAAVAQLAEISHALGIDHEEAACASGNELILEAIAARIAQAAPAQDCETVAEELMRSVRVYAARPDRMNETAVRAQILIALQDAALSVAPSQDREDAPGSEVIEAAIAYGEAKANHKHFIRRATILQYQLGAVEEDENLMLAAKAALDAARQAPKEPT